MYDDTRRAPLDPLKLIIIIIIGLVVIIGATYALNGGGKSNTPDVSDNDTNNTDNTTAITATTSIIANTSQGIVTKYSGYGSGDANVKIALIIGVDEDPSKAESVIPTLESTDNLQYSYDVYLVNATNKSADDNDTNVTQKSRNTTSTSSEALASKYVVDDIKENNYDFTAQIQSSSDGSFMFVPSDDTYTSKQVVNNISTTTGITKKTPEKYQFAKAVAMPLIKSNIPSMIFMTNMYYSDEPSNEIQEFIGAIDTFDFDGFYSSMQVTDVNDTNTSSNTTKNNTTKSTSMKTSSEIDDESVDVNSLNKSKN